MLSAYAAHEREVGDIGDGDDEDERGGAHEQPERQARPLAEDFVKWDDGDAIVGCRIVRLLVFTQEPGVDRGDFGSCLLECGARRKARDHRGHPMRASLNHLRAQVVIAHHHVEQCIDALGIERRRLEHADDRRRLVVEPHLLADDTRIAAEALQPELVRQHRHAWDTGSVVTGSRQAPEDG